MSYYAAIPNWRYDADMDGAANNTTAMSDEALMEAYGQGDVSAFEELYQRHRQGLYRYLYRHLQDEATVAELYQDVWDKVIRARSTYHPHSRFQTWLFNIAHNRAIDYYRSRLHRERHNHQPYEDDAVVELTSALQPEELAQQAQVANCLKQGLAALPAEQRDVVLLKEEAGLSLEQIALTTGVERETVKSRLRYAVNKLRSFMRRCCGE